jgi:hypothetical protein
LRIASRASWPAIAPQVQSIPPLATLADLLQHIKTVDTRSTLFVAFPENNQGQDQ